MTTAYTAVTGDYPIKRTDLKCFTGDAIFQRPVMEAKRYKIMPHLFLPDAIKVQLPFDLGGAGDGELRLLLLVLQH